jgi:hypothetical protein
MLWRLDIATGQVELTQTIRLLDLSNGFRFASSSCRRQRSGCRRASAPPVVFIFISSVRERKPRGRTILADCRPRKASRNGSGGLSLSGRVLFGRKSSRSAVAQARNRIATSRNLSRLLESCRASQSIDASRVASVSSVRIAQQSD